MATLRTPPLALYAHFPWCVQKCPYCDFNSHAVRGELPEANYLRALSDDLAAQASEVPGRKLASIFLGGGTPSLFSPESIGLLLDRAQRLVGFEPGIEITLEANPGTIERGRFAEYRAAGVTRVSLGAQSFDDAQLKTLGRIHSAAETHRAAEELHASGLGNFNLDLMYALPGQSEEGAERDLREALSLAPAHVSQYHLTIEPGTLFAAAPPTQPADEVVEQMLQRSLQMLEPAGFHQYEVSGYSRPQARCTHNLNYWRFGDYLGIGAGAHGKITQAATGVISRTQQWREPRRYLQAPPGITTRKEVTPAELPFEFAMNGLRLVEGFSETLYEERTGLAAADLASALEPARSRGLVERDGHRWRPTAAGLRYLNEILVGLLPDPPVAGGG